MKDIDKKLGAIIRARRESLGMSQEAVGRKIGVTFQQIQKYEHGRNRLTVVRLQEIAAALGCDVAAILEAADLRESGAVDGDRQTLETVKRIKLLKDDERAALAAFLNVLCRDRRAA